MADSSGQGHPGVYYKLRPLGVTAGVSGALVGVSSSSTARRYAGSGHGYDPVAVNNPTVFSLELWFRTSSTTGGKLIGLADSATGISYSNDRNFYMRDNGQLVFGIYSSTANRTFVITSPASYNNGAWHHAAATFGSTGGMVMYVDGLRVTGDASPGAPQNLTGYWRWGGDNLEYWDSQPTSDYVNGDLDEIAIYSTELSAQQIAWHYHANH
jgi:hypothetical protein